MYFGHMVYPKGYDTNLIDLDAYKEQLDAQSLENEIWKPIPGYDFYEISNFKRVRSLPRYSVDRMGRIQLDTGRIMNEVKHCKSKRKFSLRKDKFSKIIDVEILYKSAFK